LCYSSRLGIWYSRLILGPNRLMLRSGSFQIRFCFQFGLDPGFLLSLKAVLIRLLKFVLD